MTLNIDVDTSEIASALWNSEGEMFSVLEDLAVTIQCGGETERRVNHYAKSVAAYHNGSDACELIPLLLRTMADAIEKAGAQE